MAVVSNALVAAGEAVEQWDASCLYAVIDSETLKPDTGCLHDQTCLIVTVPWLYWLEWTPW